MMSIRNQVRMQSVPKKNANCSKLKKFVFGCGTMIRKLTGNGQRNYND